MVDSLSPPPAGERVRGDSPEKWTVGGEGTEDAEGRWFAQICAKNEQCTATIERALVRAMMREKCTEGGLLLNITRVVGLCGGKAPQVNSQI